MPPNSLLGAPPRTSVLIVSHVLVIPTVLLVFPSFVTSSEGVREEAYKAMLTVGLGERGEDGVAHVLRQLARPPGLVHGHSDGLKRRIRQHEEGTRSHPIIP